MWYVVCRTVCRAALASASPLLHFVFNILLVANIKHSNALLVVCENIKVSITPEKSAMQSTLLITMKDFRYFVAIISWFLRSGQHRATAFSLSSTKIGPFQWREQALMLSSSPSWNSQDDNLKSSDSSSGANGFQSSATPSSIGDYVQGIHGGKYQFEEACGATFAGRQFAEALYSSDSTEGVILDTDLMDDSEAMPSWLQKLGTSETLGPLTPLENFQVISFSPTSPTTTISIANDERSWERFYTKIIQIAPDGTIVDGASILCHTQQLDSGNDGVGAPFLVMPATGQLAPRGGSSNLCTYSDTATLQVSAIATDNYMSSGGSFFLLVIGTESETWKYWLQYQL